MSKGSRLLLASFVVTAIFSCAVSIYSLHAQSGAEALFAVTGMISPEDTEAPPEEVIVPQLPDVRIEVNIPATEMTVYENGIPKFFYKVAIGQGVYPTPELDGGIDRIEWNPSWYPPPSPWAKGAKPEPPGPNNPLGRVKMEISPAILFHGTNKESTVGRAASHGCMRMYNNDAVALAWYLQELFSDKTEQKYLDTYMKNRRTTYVVDLSSSVPVNLIYRPVHVKEGSLVLHPDHYRRVAKNKKEIVVGVLASSGVATELLDEEKLDGLIKKWPTKTTEVPINELMWKEETSSDTNGATDN